MVQPNSSRVLILFGRYIGTIAEPGLRWVNPFTAFWRRTVSLRVRNPQSERIKVNDASGSPIEIAAVVVWRVTDTAKATFDVEDYEQFVVVQSETAVRHLASKYPYDDCDEASVSLRGSADEVLDSLHTELHTRLQTAGIEVLETRLTHLAYAAEIAEVMLRRQQAEAILAARKKMVAGAVGIVQMALARLAESDLVRARSGAQGGDGLEPEWSSCLATTRRPRCSTPAPSTRRRTRRTMTESKRFLLRLSPDLFEALRHWAADDLRSINAQIEYLLTDQARRAARLPARRVVASGDIESLPSPSSDGRGEEGRGKARQPRSRARTSS